jgi:hypothetical protein
MSTSPRDLRRRNANGPLQTTSSTLVLMQITTHPTKTGTYSNIQTHELTESTQAKLTALKKARQRDATEHSKEANGGLPHILPIGYRRVLEGGEIIVIVDPVTGPLVQEAFRLVAEGKSLRDTLAIMQTKDLPGGRGGTLSLATLGRMLRNPIYKQTGPVVDERTFAIAQGKLWEKRK